MTFDITLERLLVFYLFLLIPLALMYYLNRRLIKDLLIAVLRMSLQLLLVGLYLGSLFSYNNLFLNCVWIMVMVLVAAGHIISSAGLRRRELFIPVFLAILFSLVAILSPLILYVVCPEPFYDARYMVPLGGMLLGNFLSMNIIALKHFTGELRSNRQYLQTSLCFGATYFEAVRPFFNEAFTRALVPTITTIATLGLISLPGMLTGQILGGSMPTVAIKYQIIIMLAIVVSGAISVFASIFMIIPRCFDRYGNVRSVLFKG